MREFVVLAQSGCFREAARRLYVSQPALSNHVKALEEEVGCLLVDRERNNALTPEGLVFLDAAQSALMVLGSAMEECRAIASARERICDPARIHVHMMFRESRQALARLCDKPYEFVLYEWGQPLMRRFAQNEVDIMVTYDVEEHRLLHAEADKLGLAYEPIGYDRCSVAMRSDNPLASKPLTRESLEKAEFVVLSASEFGYWKTIIRAILGKGCNPNVKLLPVESMVNMEIVDLKESVLLCMSRMVDLYFGVRDGYVVKDTLDGEPIAMRTGLVYRPDTENENVEAALEALRAGLGEAN